MGARIGYISSYDAAHGLASVYYPDLSGSVTEGLPVFTPFGATGNLKKGDMVLIEYLENGSAVVLGTLAGDAAPAAGIIVSGSSLSLKDGSGSISVAELLAIKAAHEGGA